MNPLSRLRLRLTRFAHREDGSMTVEACLLIPTWAFVIIMTFQFFDAYRSYMVNLRATYAVADMVSREETAVGPKYITNLKNVFDYVARSTKPTTLRVTSVYYDTSQKKYRVNWSYATSGAVMTDALVQAQASRIPNLNSGETLVLVETHMDYDPLFNVGLNDLDYDYFITTPPRYASQVPYSASS